jgi:DNA polymerase I
MLKARTLEDFIPNYERRATEPPSQTPNSLQRSTRARVKQSTSANLERAEEPTLHAPYGYALSVFYNGDLRKAGVKLYQPDSRQISFWYDTTNHLPYCLSTLPVSQLESVREITDHPGFDHFESVQKFDALTDTMRTMTKIVAKDPRSIGGSVNSIRERLSEAWEARIRYYNCFIYDRELQMGMPYQLRDNQLMLRECLDHTDQINVHEIFDEEAIEFRGYIDRWIQLFQCPLPSIRRAAVDIEVYSAVSTRFPDPNEARDRIIAASIVDSDGIRCVYVLLRKEEEQSTAEGSEKVQVTYFQREEELIHAILQILDEYPVILTFNGDDFDLRYIYNRAIRLGIPRQNIPIILQDRSTRLSHGIHVDLYRFFFNRSIQIYAFSQKYSALTLDSVSNALLGEGKIKLETPISDLSYSELIAYCLQDAEVTLRLTAFDDELVMKLIQIMMRITSMPMEDLTRQGVSSWIRNLMYKEHRRLNYLIPNSQNILEAKGEATSAATIKGKKFKGGIVVDPKPGVHFNVAVLDFASLYPSVIKVYNLSYETVLCSHDTCRSNTIPTLPHWICKERKGLASLIIGSLRDVRVKLYKQLAKKQNLDASLRNLYNVIQLTLKVLLNASYGVMGAESFNLYCPPLAEAVTAIGRYAITETVKKAEAIGIEVLYGDTDSVFLKAPTTQQISELVQWSESQLGMELEIDKIYRYAAFSHLKKNYFGVHTDGKVDIKGLTGKKRHIPAFLQKAFMDMVEVLSQVQSPKDFEKAKVDVKEIVKTCYQNLKKKQYPLNDLALKVMLSKPLHRYIKTTPQHVKAATLLEKAGYEIKAGDIIFFIKTSNELGVKPIQLATIGDIDTKKYIEYLESTFDQVFDTLGLEFQEILGISKLDTFFM